jgi:hypothetical protein
MKNDVVAHVSLCDVCQRVKAEHQRPAGLIQSLQVPEWKWEKLACISLWDYLALVMVMIPYGLLWTS